MDKSIAINKSFKEGFLNRGILNLLTEKFVEGWKDYCIGKETAYPRTMENPYGMDK
jgi:hypothetical protein